MYGGCTAFGALNHRKDSLLLHVPHETDLGGESTSESLSSILTPRLVRDTLVCWPRKVLDG